MKRRCLLTVAAMAFTALGFGQDIALPPPQKRDGPALYEAMDARGSAGQSNFPTGPVGLEELSTILWAASGNNRDGGKWTVPMALGRPPYCKIYVTMAAGTYRYDWKNHALVKVADGNVAGDIAMQGFAKNAATTLYVVGDGEELSTMSHPISTECGILLAGAMSQNIYLACEGLGVGVRLIYSVERERMKEKLGLGPLDQPLFAMPMGKR